MVTFEELANRQRAVAVVGLGYVGLPLAVALAKHFDVIGFDIKEDRVKALNSGEGRPGLDEHPFHIGPEVALQRGCDHRGRADAHRHL